MKRNTPYPVLSGAAGQEIEVGRITPALDLTGMADLGGWDSALTRLPDWRRGREPLLAPNVFTMPTTETKDWVARTTRDNIGIFIVVFTGA